MIITLNKGYHSDSTFRDFQQSFVNNDLMVFLPPTLDNYEFVSHLPPGEVRLTGELWTGNESLPEPRGPKEPVVAGVFSSGTSRQPRLVLYSKKNLESSTHGIFELFDREILRKIFCYPQPFHTFGLTLGYAAATLLDLPLSFPNGAYSKGHHQQWANSVDSGTLTLGTPTHFYDLIQQTPQLATFSKSYSAIIGGAKVKKDLWFQCQDILKIDQPSIGYGATEASPGVTHLPPGTAPQEDGEIGLPLGHVETRMTETGLQFQGPNLCHLIIDGDQILKPEFFELPDIVRVRERDGHWIYETRSNWFLNRGGEKFSLEALESHLKQSLELNTLCVALPDSRLGEDLGVLVEGAADSTDITKKQVCDHLFKKTQRRFSQDHIIIVDSLPLNENLKKDRRKGRDFILRENR